MRLAVRLHGIIILGSLKTLTWTSKGSKIGLKVYVFKKCSYFSQRVNDKAEVFGNYNITSMCIRRSV